MTQRAGDPLKAIEEPWQVSPFFDLSIGDFTNFSPYQDFKAFRKELEGEPELGRILASAIHFGALLNRNHWNSWLRAIRRQTRWDNLHWVWFAPEQSNHLELSSESKQPKERVQRWFADPFTAKLIENWKNRNRDIKIEADADKVLAAYLQRAHGKHVSVEDFYARARLRWHMRIPAVLVDKALGRLPTVPLSEVRWRESVGHSGFPAGIEKGDFDTFAPREIYRTKKAWIRYSRELWPEEHLAFETTDKHYRCGNISYTIWKSLTARLLRRIVDCRRESLPPWDYRILIPCWLAHRLQETQTSGKKGQSPRLMLEQLAAISALLGTNWDAIAPELKGRPKSLSAKQLAYFLASYSNRRKGVAVGLQAEAVGDLREFIKRREKSKRPPADFSKTSVSASVVTPAIYRECVSKALNFGHPGWQIDRPFQPTKYEMVAATILAFRAGLRMREILGLTVGDFLEAGTIFELHLQENAMRPLKTVKSRRILPLDVLLPEAEKSLILIWLRRRKTFARILDRDINCFGPPSHRGVIDSGPYFQAFERIFREADQPYLAFRHFRHSYSTYLLTNLSLPSAEATQYMPAQLRGEVNWSRRTELSRRFLGDERIGQSALHAVSLSMGHTGIYRTLESYQHLLDLTLGLYVNDPNIHGNEGRALLYYAGLVYARREEANEPQRLGPSEPGFYKSPNKPDFRLSSRPTVFKTTDSGREAAKSEDRLAKDRARWEAEIINVSDGGICDDIDWVILREVMKTRDQESLSRLKKEFQISDDDAAAWRRFDRTWNKIWSDPERPKQYSPAYFGAQATFCLNLLWAGYQRNKPSEEVREAISNFVAGYDRTNLGAKMGTIERCLRLEDYLVSIGFLRTDFDYNEYPRSKIEVYALTKWQNRCPLKGSFKFTQNRRVVIKNENPRLRLRRREDYDAMGSSSDVSRAARKFIAMEKSHAGETSKIPDHKQVTAALNFFIYLVAAKEGIVPKSLDARNKVWKSERDFKIESRTKRMVRYRPPHRS